MFYVILIVFLDKHFFKAFLRYIRLFSPYIRNWFFGLVNWFFLLKNSYEFFLQTLVLNFLVLYKTDFFNLCTLIKYIINFGTF